MPCSFVTITSTGVVQQITTNQQRVAQLQFQNKGTHVMHIGDVVPNDAVFPGPITANKSLDLQAGGADNVGGFASAGSTVLNWWYVLGTAGDVLAFQWSQTP